VAAAAFLRFGVLTALGFAGLPSVPVAASSDVFESALPTSTPPSLRSFWNRFLE
jgi:hypothetical protein